MHGYWIARVFYVLQNVAVPLGFADAHGRGGGGRGQDRPEDPGGRECQSRAADVSVAQQLPTPTAAAAEHTAAADDDEAKVL